MIPGTLLLQLLQQLGTALLCRQLQLVEGRRDVGPRLAGFRPWRMLPNGKILQVTMGVNMF